MLALTKRSVVIVCCVVSMICAARGETLVLSSAFVEQVKNKAAISATLEVDAFLKKPHPISSGGNDGDIHMAGRADEVQLPLVAEIVNAALESSAVAALNQITEGQKVPVTGVWRIWFEHLGREDQIQGNPVEVPANSNPAHLFEIHPITNFAGNDVLSSFTEIKGYSAYPAHVAFPFYEQDSATIQAADSSISITSGEGKYNYAEFVIELTGTAACTDAAGASISCGDSKAESLFVLANVFDSQDDAENPVTSDPRRMVFVVGTDPANQVARLSKGDRLHVLGIPRVNLAEVAALAAQDAATTTLPYEMIVVAVLP